MRAVRRTAKFAAKTVTFLIAPFVGFTASQDRWSMVVKLVVALVAVKPLV
jgi:hypothetical protein